MKIEWTDDTDGNWHCTVDGKPHGHSKPDGKGDYDYILASTGESDGQNYDEADDVVYWVTKDLREGGRA